MNPEKLKKLQAQAELVRIGGKGMESDSNKWKISRKFKSIFARIFLDAFALSADSCHRTIDPFRNSSSQEEDRPPDRRNRW